MGSKQKTTRPCSCIHEKFRNYFKIGVADDFILIRADFPMTEISPVYFSELVKEMFQQNDEVRNHGK